jgi:hypothetical protein
VMPPFKPGLFLHFVGSSLEITGFPADIPE